MPHVITRNGGCEFNIYTISFNPNIVWLDDIQLLQCEWMFGVFDVAQEIEHFVLVNLIDDVRIVFELG